MMNYKEISGFECPNEQCWLREGENCKLDLERFNELQSNDTLSGLQCMGSYFTMQKIRRHLESQQLGKLAENKTFGNYQQYKQELDTELRKTTEGFVKIGYLLKVAKDTDILKESGYANVYEFAQAEYSIDKSQVSRFMNINDRFSEGGYSERLKEQYRGFGHAKLAIMLQLPEEINAELTPDFSKSEIQALKEEYDAEKAVTDLEVLMEGEEPAQSIMDSNLHKILYQMGKEEPELYVELCKAYYESPAAVMDTLAPDGEKIYNIRIMGVGRLMLSIKGLKKPVTLTNMRTMEKEEYPWEEVFAVLATLWTDGEEPEEAWAKVYNEDFPKREKVAPVQQNLAKAEPVKKDKQKKEAPKKESKVKKAKTTEPKQPEEPQPEPEEQLPGQDSILDHPEWLPEGMKNEDAENVQLDNILENVTRDAEIVAKTPLEEPETLIKPKSEAVSGGAAGLTESKINAEKELQTIWSDTQLAVAKLNLFFQNWSSTDIAEGSIPADTLQNAYKKASDVAAGLERIINHGEKYNAR